MNILRYHIIGGWQRVFHIIASFFRGFWLQFTRGVILYAWVISSFFIGVFALGLTQSSEAGVIAGIGAFAFIPAVVNPVYEAYQKQEREQE